MHSPPPQIWEGNGGASYSPNAAYLARCWGAGGRGRRQWNEGFFSYFPPLKPRCVLWSGVSYSPKTTVYFKDLIKLINEQEEERKKGQSTSL